jgi:hypothetical protein
MNMTSLWDVASCSLVEVHRRFRDAYWFHHQVEDGGSTRMYCDVSEVSLVVVLALL